VNFLLKWRNSCETSSRQSLDGNLQKKQREDNNHPERTYENLGEN